MTNDWRSRFLSRFGAKKLDWVILVPVFNDFASAQRLVSHIVDAAALPRGPGLVLVVDDGSTEVSDLAMQSRDANMEVGVLRLRANVGHQRAIAVGLGFVSSWISDSAIVVVMDGDGEDRPEDIPRLLACLAENPRAVIVANRARRREAAIFRIAYVAYRFLYRLLTGQAIRHGNFSAMSGRNAVRLAHSPSLWSHFAASIYLARVPVIGVEVDRGARYHGASKMNAVSLVVHGLSAISVHIEAVGVRMLLGALAISLAALLALIGVVVIRLATSLAIPGWASAVGGSFLILAMLGMLLSLQLVFIVLSARERRPVIPAVEAPLFIEDFIES